MRAIRFNFRLLAFYSLCVFWAALTFSNALVEITFISTLVLWLASQLQRRKFVLGPLPQSLWIPLSVFIFLSVLSFLWSEYPPQSFRGVFKILQQVMVFFLVTGAVQDKKDLKRFETLFTVVFLMVVADAFYQYGTGKDFLRGFESQPSMAGVRINASFKTYGQLASYLISTIPFLAALWWNQKKQGIGLWRFGFLGLVLLASLAVLYWTRSRGAMVAFGAGLIFILILKRKLLLLFLLLLGFGSSLFFLPRGMLIHYDIRGKEQSLVERYYLWDRAMQVIQANPWGGTGINTYAAAHAKFDKTQNWRVRGYYAHNGYLQLAAETGLPCLFFFLLFLVQYFWQSLKKLRWIESPEVRNLGAALLLGVFNFLLVCLVDTSLHNPQPAMTFWFLLGLQWSCQKMFVKGSEASRP